jgi:hypothetical protein
MLLGHGFPASCALPHSINDIRTDVSLQDPAPILNCAFAVAFSPGSSRGPIGDLVLSIPSALHAVYVSPLNMNLGLNLLLERVFTGFFTQHGAPDDLPQKTFSLACCQAIQLVLHPAIPVEP